MRYARFSIVVGALLRGYIRRSLDDAEFHGHIESWKESKGFLDSTFYIEKPSDLVVQWLKDLSDKLEANNAS